MALLVRLASFIVLFLALITSGVSAATFQILQDTGTTRIRDDIMMWGTIDHGDDDKFRELVISRLNQGRLIGEIRLYSPGGDVNAAIGIGNQIRLLRTSTRSPGKLPNGQPGCPNKGGGTPGYVTGPGCTCESACSLIWLAGSPRLGFVVGIHAPRYNEAYYGSLTEDQAEEQYKVIIEQIHDYLGLLDVPEFVQREMFSSSSAEMYFLSDSEIYSLLNSPAAFFEYISARCGDPPSDQDTSPAARKWADCDTRLEDAYAGESARKYLEVYGGGAPGR